VSDPQSVDVLIAGAGPAGLHLARLLAQAGASVQVVDPLLDLRHSAFSSAALPMEAVQEFELPAQSAGSAVAQLAVVWPG